MSRELDTGPGHSQHAQEVHRRSSGRLRFVVAREGGEWWLHVQPAPSLTSMSRRFRESHALRLLGLTPVAACRFFPAACAFAGCYSSAVVPPSGGAVTDELASIITARLEPAIDGLMQAAADLEPTGLKLD